MCRRSPSVTHTATVFTFDFVVVVVHQPSPELMANFDHLLVMNAGRVTFQGSPETEGVLPGSSMDIIDRQTKRSLESSGDALNSDGRRDLRSPRSFYDGKRANSLRRLPVHPEEDEADLEDTESPEIHRPLESSSAVVTHSEKENTSTNECMNPPERPDPPGRPAVAQETRQDTNMPKSGENPKHPQTPFTTTNETETSELEFVVAFKQMFFLIQRLQIEYGWEWSDALALCSVYTIMASLLLLEPVYNTRVLLMTMSMICIPQILFSNKAIRYGRLWLDHRLELDDRLVRILPFHLATEAFSFTMPVVGILMGTFPVYLILGWNLRTYFIHAIFSGLSCVGVILIGRFAAVWFRGRADAVVQVMTLVILAGFAFSSIPIASWKFPPYLRWIVYFSLSFWGISGSVMTLFDPDTVYDNSEECVDALTCVSSDGRFITHVLGFAQHTTQHMSLTALVSIIVFMMIANVACLYYRRR